MLLDVAKFLSGIRPVALQAVIKTNAFLAMVLTTANELIPVSTEKDRQTPRDENKGHGLSLTHVSLP